MKNFKTFIRDIKYGLSNYLGYARVIWNDRDWDWLYLVILLRFKLYRMEYAIRNGMSVRGPKDADKIKTCVLLCDRLIKDEYYLTHNDLGEDSQQQDINLLFKIMSKNLRGWWD